MAKDMYGNPLSDHLANPSDGLKIHFTKTVHEHNAGEVKIVSTPRARKYIADGVAVLAE